MRRHVQSVNRRRRNLGIAPCCCQRAVGQHWVVVSMDDVMSHPRMIGQLSEDFFQDRASFLLLGVAGVAWRRVRDYLQGIEKSRFAVVGICRIQVLHGFLIVQKAMEHLYTAYPDDREAALFYALQVIANAPPRDSSYAEQKKAGAILEKIFAELPNHPGVAHYIIHAYDDPMLANRALAAARSYAKIAPSSVHALHMPSHIFIQVGSWQEAIASNLASLAAARAWVARSRRKELWDQQAHAQDYLAYAYLQTGQDQLARNVRDEVSSYSDRFGETPRAAYSALVGIPARYALERHQWSEAAALPIRKVPMPLYEAETYFARAIGCARTGDLAGARSNADKLAELRDRLPQGNQGWEGNADLVQVQLLQAEAWLADAEKRDADAVKLVKSAITLEESTPATWIAAPLLAGNEQLGDLLLEQNQPEQALAAYEASLQLAPNRFNSLLGGGRAAELAGARSKAETYYSQLLALCKNAESQRPELHLAKSFLEKQAKLRP